MVCVVLWGPPSAATWHELAGQGKLQGKLLALLCTECSLVQGLTRPLMVQEVVDCVVAQVSAIAAPGSRLCLDLIPRGLLEGRVKPTRGFTNGRDVRPLLQWC